MLVVSLLCQNEKELWQNIQKLSPKEVQGIEIRWDKWKEISVKRWEELKRKIPFKIIFTIRKKSQGGLFSGTETEREKYIDKLFALKPDYFDLEYDTSPELLHYLSTKYPQVQIILSYHDFLKTPPHLEKIYDLLQNSFPADLYKIATLAHSTEDALRMILFTKKSNQVKSKLIGFCMGEKGQISRIVGPIMKSPITYAYVEKKTAPGQLSIEEICKVYYFPHLTPKTSIYALIGNPTGQSISHKTHNKVFSLLHIPAVYLKLDINDEELDTCLEIMKEIPFQGLSITMPLKEKVFPSQSLNTLALTEKKWRGISTDGIGTIRALEEHTSLHNKKILLIGAGGTALAIGKALRSQTPHITVYNRTDSKAQILAKKLSCQFVSSQNPPTKIPYDILIQASSCGMKEEDMPLEEHLILPHTIVFECVMKNTLLLKVAEKKGCLLIPGSKLFFYQALEQFRFWFPKISPKVLFQAMEDAIRSSFEKP